MRTILITGANGGLGQAIARSFLAESPENHVWLGVFVRRENADKLAAEFSGRCRAVDLDVTQPDSWKKAVDTILAEHKRIDVLVNNAGKHNDGLLATMPLGTWDSIVRTNLDATSVRNRNSRPGWPGPMWATPTGPTAASKRS